MAGARVCVHTCVCVWLYSTVPVFTAQTHANAHGLCVTPGVGTAVLTQLVRRSTHALKSAQLLRRESSCKAREVTPAAQEEAAGVLKLLQLAQQLRYHAINKSLITPSLCIWISFFFFNVLLIFVPRLICISQVLLSSGCKGDKTWVTCPPPSHAGPQARST